MVHWVYQIPGGASRISLTPKDWLDIAVAGLVSTSSPCITYICLVVWNICFSPYIGNVIIPTDFPIFQRARSTTNQI